MTTEQITLGSIETDGHGRQDLMLDGDTITCEGEPINAPKARDLDHAREIVSQLYSGADWALELAE